MNNWQELKIRVHDQCLQQLAERLVAITHDIKELRASANEQSKSSAGDKHETGRAMADLEIEKQQLSLKNVNTMQAVLRQLDPHKTSEKISLGTLVKTQAEFFYLAVALGKIMVDGKNILVISPDAPLATAFIKAREKSVSFNERVYEIQEIC